MKLIWKLLVGAGLLLVIWALSMDTSVSTGYGGRVHNIGLQQDRTLLLIFGCVVFMAGIVLFGVMKLRQTPEQHEEEQERMRKSIEAVREKVHAKVRNLDAGTEPAPGSPVPPGSKQFELKGDFTDFIRR